jgi:hypothetical protein
MMKKIINMWVWTIMAFTAMAQNAPEKNNIFIKDAQKKAAVFAHKMAETLNLSKKQTADIYKLRLELSLALRVIYHEHSDNTEKMIELAKVARNQFHKGMLRVLNEEQATLWNEYKKELIASQQYQDMINSTAIFSGY